MNARNFFRRVNRGLVLAGLLVVGLVIYLAAGAILFRAEIPAIEQMIHDYAAEAESLMILPQELQTPGKPAPEAAIEAKIKESEPILRKYLSDTTVNRWSWPVYRNVSNAQKHSLESNQGDCSYVTGCSYLITGVKKVRKISTNLAIADIEVKATVDTIGSPSYIMLFEQEYGSGFNYAQVYPDKFQQFPGHSYEYEDDEDEDEDDDDDEDAREKFDTESHTQTRHVTFQEVYLKKTDGVWRICETSGMWWH